MSNDDDFGFEEEVPAAAEKEAALAEEEQLRESLGASGARRRFSLVRLLLLLVLLAGLGGAGLFLFLGEVPVPAPEPAPVVPQKQRIAIPTPPPAAVPEETIVAAEPEETVVEEGDAPAPPAESAGGEPVAAGKPVASGVSVGAYTVEAGAYRLESSLKEAEERLRRIGFEPQVTTAKKALAMTRLRVGSFAPEAGRAKLEALAELAPDAFVVRKGDELVVYAASYHDLDKARRFADRLHAEGVQVEEEAAEVEVPLFLLRSGIFPDLASARAAAARVRAEGLEALVVKKRLKDRQR